MSRQRAVDASVRDTSTVSVAGRALRETQRALTMNASQSLHASTTQALDATTRTFMESRFGHDFSRVRIRTDGEAAHAARSLGALAYTVGNDIAFAPGRYAPTTGPGRRLIAHELTHVVQQSSSARVAAKLNTAQHAPSEREADRVAERILSEEPLPTITPMPVNVACAPDAGVPPPPAPTLQQINNLKRDLRTTIAGATWPEIRKRRYPAESAPGIARAKARKEGRQVDLIGLGKLTRLEHLATAIRKIQKDWSGLSSATERARKIGAAANDELQAVDVPGFLEVAPMTMTPKAGFSGARWKFMLSDLLLTGNSLANDDAADLANSAMHESRHAEQHFLSARFSAGSARLASDDVDTEKLRAEQGIPKVIAAQAIKKKFTSGTDARTQDLGRQMFKAHVTDGPKNQATSGAHDTAVTELDRQRGEAQKAHDALTSGASAQQVSNATTRLDELRAQITAVEKSYGAYRAIPSEADAHEVGDAAGQAFKGWP